MEKQPLEGRPVGTWSPLFKSSVVFFTALGLSSAASLFRYVPSLSFPVKMLFEGTFFGLSLAGFLYVLLNLLNRQGPLSRRETMIIVPLVGLLVILLVTCDILVFQAK